MSNAPYAPETLLTKSAFIAFLAHKVENRILDQEQILLSSDIVSLHLVEVQSALVTF